jgi:hypothetical protein
VSWDATLKLPLNRGVLTMGDGRTQEVTALWIGDWNYTHNTSRMIYRVLDTVRWPRGENESWWALLNGMSGEEGARFLGVIVGGLMEAPELFRSMNPENGWGDYDSLLRTLEEMRQMSAATPVAEWWADG